jgi:hypothetical protein
VMTHLASPLDLLVINGSEWPISSKTRPVPREPPSVYHPAFSAWDLH